MIYNENYEGIKMDVQTINMEMDRFLEQKIRSMIKKLKGLLPAANWIAIHLKKSVHQASYPGKVSVRLGIPGPDIIASDSGYNWKTMLKNVEKKLIRQLNKKKNGCNAGFSRSHKGLTKY